MVTALHDFWLSLWGESAASMNSWEPVWKSDATVDSVTGVVETDCPQTWWKFYSCNHRGEPGALNSAAKLLRSASSMFSHANSVQLAAAAIGPSAIKFRSLVCLISPNTSWEKNFPSFQLAVFCQTMSLLMGLFKPGGRMYHAHLDTIL